MASQIKQKLIKNMYDVFHHKVSSVNFNDVAGSFSLIRAEPNEVTYKIHLPSSLKNNFNSDLLRNSQKELIENKTVKSIDLDVLDPFVYVKLDVKRFIKDILDSDPTKINYKNSPKKTIIEFSSPNIAKPFHMGHLRSTIIGNSIANIKKKFGDDIIRMNYLGDWGTQFGIIQLGMNLEKYSEEDLQKDPLEVLFKAYVKGNQEAEKNLDLYNEAKKIFHDLEAEKEEITELWRKYRNWTTDELKATYERLGVSFDEYTWESDCNKKKVNNILNMLEQKGILLEDDLGRKVAVVGENKVPLLKSDGTTLYLLRDLVAAAERREKHCFDEMYYVVENSQSEHFHYLTNLISQLNIDKGIKIEHVKFGKVEKMSTRKGKVVFLKDVLNEARERVYARQVNSKHTKVLLQNKDTADILGVSAVIINDLQYKRLRNYQFSWDTTIDLKGNTGVWLQYCHCRLCNLEIESGGQIASECDPEAFTEPEAINLALAIARYEESLHGFHNKLEPCVLVKYLFDLVSSANVAYKTLQIKKIDSHLGSQRLLLFNRCKNVLNEGMKLLGLKPLTKM